MRNDHNILIIGAGPTGLGAAWRLQELGYTNWDIVEASHDPGGLAASVVDNKGFTWDLGGHVLFSHYAYFDAMTNELLGNQWVDHVRESWVWMRDRFIPYPLQNNIWRLPQEDVLACVNGLLSVHGRAPRDRSPANFHEWILRQFGQGLADVFLLPYNRKVWAYDPRELGTGWMGERVATVDLKRILENLVLQRDDCGWGPNARFRYPLHGGTGAIWRALYERLPGERKVLGRRLTAVSSHDRTVTFADNSTRTYDSLVSTIPFDVLVRKIQDRPDLGVVANEFKHSSTHIIGVGVKGRVPEGLATKCWIYFPESSVPFYRATVFSNYSPFNVPEPGLFWSLMCEVSESPNTPVNLHTVVDETVHGLHISGLLPDSATMVSRWHRRLEHGYPTPFLNRDVLLAQIDPDLCRLGIFSRGRFGAWKYEVSNQDHSFMQGVEAINHILLGSEEHTYRHPSVVNAMGPAQEEQAG